MRGSLFFINFAFKHIDMEKFSLEIFMPFSPQGVGMSVVRNFVDNLAVQHVWLWCIEHHDCVFPQKVTVLCTESITETDVFMDMAKKATADFVVCINKEGVMPDMELLERMCDAIPSTASMAYADYRKEMDGVVTDAPVIDYFSGSLRNDFDFGSLLLFRTSALKAYVDGNGCTYRYAGLYQLRLAMSRLGSLFHFKEFLYTERENDTRKSGEKQFDYVNPAQREVQIEMERVCTEHLRVIGAYLPPCIYEDIDLSAGNFPVEASVIIPVLNRESTIADAIGSVLKQQTTFPFNILVVDNHSTDNTGNIVDSFADRRVVHVVPERHDLGIGGCWELAVNHEACGRFAVQLDSDDLYSGEDTLQRIVDGFYEQQCAMLIGTYRICDFGLNTLPPGIIDHREWSEDNGRNNALRINGLGAPRAFYTPVIREIGFPNVSYGEDYAVGLQISRRYRIGRIYDVLYLCRRWGGNSDAALSHDKVNAHNLYKDSLRTVELEERIRLMKQTAVPSGDELLDFFEQQLKCWPEAASRFEALSDVRTRELENGIVLQYNPARMVSTGAKVDKVTIGERTCFLCADNRPSVQISKQAFSHMDILVNPYPILPLHFTLPQKNHTCQLLEGMYSAMLVLAKEWHNVDIAIFYNGAKCGASAPDHAHLQAASMSMIPVLGDKWKETLSCGMEPLCMRSDGAVYNVKSYLVPMFMILSRSVSFSKKMFAALSSAMPLEGDEREPRMNVICYYTSDDGYVTMIFPRSVHRPACYGDTEGLRMVSPGALDMAGMVITPREHDFKDITADEAAAILQEVAVSREAADEIAENIEWVL